MSDAKAENNTEQTTVPEPEPRKVTMVRQRPTTIDQDDPPPPPSEEVKAMPAPPNVSSQDGEEVSRRVISRTAPDQKRRVQVTQPTSVYEPEDSDSDFDDYGIKQTPTGEIARGTTFGQEQIQRKVELEQLHQVQRGPSAQASQPPAARFFQGSVNNPIQSEEGNVRGMFAGSKPSITEPKQQPFRRRAGVKPMDEQAAQKAFQGANEVINQHLSQNQPAASLGPASLGPAQGFSPVQSMPVPVPMALPSVPRTACGSGCCDQKSSCAMGPAMCYDPSYGPAYCPRSQPPCSLACCQAMANLEQEVRFLRQQMLELMQTQAQICEMASPRSEFDSFRRQFQEAKQQLNRAVSRLDSDRFGSCRRKFQRCCDYDCDRCCD